MNIDKGWIKIHRKIEENPMYLQMNSKQRDVLIQVLLMANHQSREWLFKGQLYKVEPGQFICSLSSIQEKCASDVSIRNIRTALLLMSKHGFLTNHSTKQNRLISICKWHEYQDKVTKEVTDNRQTTDKRLTTNKNDKNDKKSEQRTITDQELTAIIEAYNKSRGRKLTSLPSDTQKNIAYWLAFHPIEEIVTAIELLPRVQDTFLSGLGLDTLFRQKNKSGPCDYIEQILTQTSTSSF